MFSDLNQDILTSMNGFPVLVKQNPYDSRCAAVAAALEKISVKTSNWAAEPDAQLRHEKKVLHSGFSAAAEICRALIAGNASRV